MSIFADTEQTRVWVEHLRSLEAPDCPVTLPEGAALVERLDFLGVPEEDIPDVVSLAPVIRNSPDLWWYLEHAVWSFATYMGKIDGPPRIAALRDINDPTYRYFYVLVYAAALPYVRQYHRQRGIPDDISQATLADVGRNVRVHRKREGIGGLGVAWWLMIHFRGVIYQLGRLQFEMSRLGSDLSESAVAAGVELDADSPALSIHIPDFSGSMSPELCDESIARAESFFPRYFPEACYRVATCHSWLLDPRLREHLRAESNIIRFQDRFRIGRGEWDSTEGILQFVFGKKLEDLDSIVATTSLERAVVDHIRAGGQWRGYGGWFPLHHLETGSSQ